ncbi:4393_t:CDS:2 [Gigaspora rosea]|nr:4393_t:CDS:2 [Gigaspora rosea]
MSHVASVVIKKNCEEGKELYGGEQSEKPFIWPTIFGAGDISQMHPNFGNFDESPEGTNMYGDILQMQANFYDFDELSALISAEINAQHFSKGVQN